MAYINLSTHTKTARAASMNAIIGNQAHIAIYTGVQPESPEDEPTGDLLVEMVGSTPFGTVVEGVLTAGQINFGTAGVNGIAGWARISTSSGTPVMDLDVGVSDASIMMNTLSVVAGGPVQITSLVISEA